jgi:hypothetical protein
VTTAIYIYLAAFLGAGLLSVLTDIGREPVLEIVGELVVLLVLCAGIVFYQRSIAIPGGNLLWLLPVSMACVAELAIILRSRKRTISAELALTSDQGEIKRLVLLTDLSTGLLFVPALALNVLHALR